MIAATRWCSQSLCLATAVGHTPGAADQLGDRAFHHRPVGAVDGLDAWVGGALPVRTLQRLMHLDHATALEVVHRACNGQSWQATPKVTRRFADKLRVIPAGQVIVPAAGS